MTIKECIDIVDNAKPNQYTIKEKVMWLSFVDETIINDVLKTHEGYDGRYDDFTGYTEDKLSVPLIVPSPYDRLYPQYIKMMIDSENGETARYNNSAALYNTYLTEYKKWYNKTHMPINGTLKTPSPVNININSGLSEAQIENIKRQLYYMLSEDFSEATSRDKLYDIVTNYVLNNLEMIRANDGKDGKDGKDGTLWIPFKFDIDIQKGEKQRAEFDFSRNIFRFGYKTYDDLDKNDYPDIYEWAVGDFFVSNNGNVLRITRLEWLNSEMLNFDAECIFEFTDIVVDQTYNPSSRNAISGKAAAEAFVAMDEYKANTDLSNVDNEVFAAKAEEAGIGNAGLTEEKSGLKRIGFTDDCNYVAVDGNASAAFITAVREANDGDTIIVMPGTYNGGSQLDIAKNLTFVGIGRPTLDFVINVEYADTVVYNTNWYNFDFNGEIGVSSNQGYNEPFVHSSFNVFGCTVKKPNYIFVGNSRHSTIVFNKRFGSMGGNFGYPGNSYEYCDIYLEEVCSGELVATNCNIYIDFDDAEMEGYFTFKNCNIYNPKNKKLGQLWNSYGNKSAKDCNVFGHSCFQEDEIIEGCKLFGCTEL